MRCSLLASNSWLATAGTYQILVGDSSRNLPLTDNLTVPTTATANVLAGLAAISVVNPFGMSSPLGSSAKLQISGSAGLTYTATGLPAGLMISRSGLVSGTGSAKGTSTITVTGTSASEASADISFVWTVS